MACPFDPAGSAGHISLYGEGWFQFEVVMGSTSSFPLVIGGEALPGSRRCFQAAAASGREAAFVLLAKLICRAYCPIHAVNWGAWFSSWPELCPSLEHNPQLEPEALWDQITRRIADLRG